MNEKIPDIHVGDPIRASYLNKLAKAGNRANALHAERRIQTGGINSIVEGKPQRQRARSFTAYRECGVLVLDSDSRSLEIVLDEAVATSQLDIVAVYVDFEGSNAGRDVYLPAVNCTTTDDDNAVTTVPPPLTGRIRSLKFLTVKNTDTADAVLTLRYDDAADAGSPYEIHKQTLAVGETLVYADGEGFRTINSAGQVKYAGSGGGSGGDGTTIVRVTTTSLGAAYTRTGNTITADANGALPAQDGVTLIATDLILLRFGIGNFDSGVWTVTDPGDGSSPFVLDRYATWDTSEEIVAGRLVVVTEGDVYFDSLWELSTDDPHTLNSGSLLFNRLDGILSINNATGKAQTLLVGTTGTDFAIVSSLVSNSHTFNLPDASATARGVVTTSTQTIAGAKAFTGAGTFQVGCTFGGDHPSGLNPDGDAFIVRGDTITQGISKTILGDDYVSHPMWYFKYGGVSGVDTPLSNSGQNPTGQYFTIESEPEGGASSPGLQVTALGYAIRERTSSGIFDYFGATGNFAGIMARGGLVTGQGELDGGDEG